MTGPPDTPNTEAQLLPPGSRSLVGGIEILRALVSKELKVKYKRSILGFVWSLVTPLALAAVYLFVFIYIYNVGKPDFILFLLTGLFPWHYFNLSILAATTSLVDNGPLIRRLYFPRFLLPVSSVAANLINFLLALAILSVVLVITGRPIWLHLHWLLLAIVLETLLATGVALAMSAWNVYVRDIQQLIGIVLLVMFFGTPIVYEISLIPQNLRWLILSNPLASIMHLYRSALYVNTTPQLWLVGLGILETAVVLGSGFLAFRRVSPNLAKEV